MDFWKQRLGGDWRLVAAVQQPSLESGGSQIDVFLSEYNVFDIGWRDSVFCLILQQLAIGQGGVRLG